MLTIGMVIEDRYKILSEIGRGGTSCVYLAENIRLHNLWAIKEVYINRLTGDGAQSNILVAESSILTKLRHPGLPSIVDIIRTSESLLIVMEYIEGISLNNVLEQRHVCSQDDVVKWGCQLCDVLSYLHSQNPPIVYRDMKPANVMLKPDGNIVLIDFGMAREFKRHTTHDTTNLGTHGYAAPEQYRNDRQSDARTDIYSLGVTLYHLVTGHDPCLPPYGIQPIRDIHPELSTRLDQIIRKCTELEPENRYADVKELGQALAMVSDGSKETVFLDAPIKKKNTGLVVALIVVPLMLLLVVFSAVSGLGKQLSSGFNLFDAMGQVVDEAVADAQNVDLYFEQDVTITTPEEHKFYSFEPEKSGYYRIYSETKKIAPVVWVMQEDGSANGVLLNSDNTYGDHFGFSVTVWLEKGEDYTIETALYSKDDNIPATGSYTIYLEYIE